MIFVAHFGNSNNMKKEIYKNINIIFFINMISDNIRLYKNLIVYKRCIKYLSNNVFVIKFFHY